MELLGIVFVTLVAGVLAAMDPQPCCLSNKFSGTMFQLGATVFKSTPIPKVNDNYIHINYDTDNNMMAIESHALNETTGRRDKVNLFFNYNMHRQYIVTEDGHCYFKHMMNSSSLDRPCIPANFTYAASFKVGSHDKSVLTNTFMGMQGKMMTRFTVTGNDCTPVSQAAVGENEDGNFDIHSYFYADMQQDYNTVGAFSMPTACNHAMDITGHRKRDLEELYDAPAMPFVQ